MKKYDVSISDEKDHPFKQLEIEASSPAEAYKIFVESTKPLPYKRIHVNWGLLGTKCFDAPHYDGHIDFDDPQKLEEERQKSLEEERRKLKETISGLTEKIVSKGFKELNSEEINTVVEILDGVFLSSEFSEDALKLTQVTLSDEQVYRFFSLRTSSRTSLQQQAMLEAMNVNLSDISQKTGGVKMASMFTGIAAARHLGEEIAEDMGGGDDDGGGWDE